MADELRTTYFPWDTEATSTSCPLAREELTWRSPLRRALPALTVMTQRRKGRKCSIFVPGLNGTWDTWLPFLRAMKWLGVDPGAVFVLDFTQTRFPATVADLDDVCKHVLAFACAGGYTEIHVVGHSTGGCLATFMGTLTSEAVQVANLYSVSGMFVGLFDAAHLSLSAALRGTTAARNLAKLRVIARAGAVANLGLRAIARSDTLSRHFLAGLYARPEAVPPGALQANIRSFSVQTLRDTLAIGSAYEYRAVYPQVRVPVRLVVGDRDPLVTEQDASAAAILVPRLSFAVLGDTGHFAHLERPVETVEELYR